MRKIIKCVPINSYHTQGVLLSFIKVFLEKFGSGLFIGIVAGISAGFIFGIISMLMNQSIWSRDAEIREQATITKDREVTRKGITMILGSLKNNSEDSMRMFKIKADLFDENGTFIEQCSEYISDLDAGKQTHFKIICKSCDSNKTIEHSSYKIYLGGF